MKASDRDNLLVEMSGQLGVLTERSESTNVKLDQHNGDIRALEKWQAKLTGAFCLLAAVVVFFQTEIKEVVTDLLR